jgi:hypothetical protein
MQRQTNLLSDIATSLDTPSAALLLSLKPIHAHVFARPRMFSVLSLHTPDVPLFWDSITLNHDGFAVWHHTVPTAFG